MTGPNQRPQSATVSAVADCAPTPCASGHPSGPSEKSAVQIRCLRKGLPPSLSLRRTSRPSQFQHGPRRTVAATRDAFRPEETYRLSSANTYGVREDVYPPQYRRRRGHNLGFVVFVLFVVARSSRSPASSLSFSSPLRVLSLFAANSHPWPPRGAEGANVGLTPAAAVTRFSRAFTRMASASVPSVGSCWPAGWNRR